MSHRRHRIAAAADVLASASALASLLIAVAAAAGAFDGNWQGVSVGSYGPGCSTRTAASFAVRADQVSGEDLISPGSFMPAGSFPVSGTIAADGTLKGSVGDWSLRGKFSGDSFEGDYEFGQCTMIMRLQRVK
jgi:hypothetical protein